MSFAGGGISSVNRSSSASANLFNTTDGATVPSPFTAAHIHHQQHRPDAVMGGGHSGPCLALFDAVDQALENVNVALMRKRGEEDGDRGTSEDRKRSRRRPRDFAMEMDFMGSGRAGRYELGGAAPPLLPAMPRSDPKTFLSQQTPLGSSLKPPLDVRHLTMEEW